MGEKKITITQTTVVYGILALIFGYFCAALYFDTIFCANTTINGIDVSFKSVSEVQRMLEAGQEPYVLELQTIDGITERISGASFVFTYSFENVQNLKAEQMGWTWLPKLFTQTDYSFEPTWSFDTEKLTAQIGRLYCMNRKMTAPVNASLTIDANTFKLVEEKSGNTLKTEKMQEVLVNAVDSCEASVDLVTAQCYETPEITLASEEITKVLEEVDALCEAEITYDFRGEKEVIGLEQIRSWVRRDENGKLYVSWNAAHNYLKKLAEKYDTIYSHRQFKNSWGDMITLEPGNYGWEMATYTETNQIMEDIANHRTVMREPVYNMTPYDYLKPDSPDDIGDTYVEIDLSSQHMWYYLDGKLFLETPITSGTLYAGMGTPAGVYYIYNRLQNTILVGDNYRTRVNYWMQVNGGIGIHDSLWRTRYGGTEYLYDGSHGCINTPYWAVESLFWNVNVGTPVVLYY